MNEKSFSHPDKGEIILPTANVYSSPEVMDEIVQNIVPLYSLVMSKYYSFFNYYRVIRTTNKKVNFK